MRLTSLDVKKLKRVFCSKIETELSSMIVFVYNFTFYLESQSI